MNILFGGKAFEKILPCFDTLLEGHLLSVAASLEDLPQMVKDVEILVTGPMEVSENLLQEAPRLRLVQQWGTGVDMIDMDACTRNGVLVCNVPSRGTGNAEGVAEIAILHLLLLARRYARARENLGKGRLYAPQGISLWGKQATVIGLGNVGQCIVERLTGFGLKVVGVNRTKRGELENLGMTRLYGFDGLEAALKGSRFVLLALELNDATRCFADEAFFGRLERGGFFINVGRAGLVDRKALERALENGTLSGAGLDVFWDEPADPDDHLLFDQRVVVTPHIGGITDVAFQKTTSFVVGNVRRFGSGQKPLSLLNPEAFGRWNP